MTTYHDDDVFSGSSSRIGTTSKKAPSRRTPSASGQRSPSSTRGTSLADSFGDDEASGRHSLAHELAYALMPESGGSKLLAEELGIEYDEGAQGIDESAETNGEAIHPDGGESLEGAFGSSIPPQEESDYGADTPLDLDPAFETPTKSQRQNRLPEQDPMVVLAADLESTDKFLSQLRRLDLEQGSQPNLERLASDMIRRIDDTVREREGQVRELLEYEREFRRIAGEIGGNEVLGHLDELDELIVEDRRPDAASPHDTRSKALDIIREEPESSHSLSNGVDWEADLERDRARLEEDDYETAMASPPLNKTSFIVPPVVDGPPTPKATVTQLSHFRSFTTTVASSLATISEQTQVNAAATTEAGRKIRALKNKLGGWKTEWESAERSRAKIERWEAGLADTGESTLVVVPTSPTRSGRHRVDGRRVVKEHMEAFEHALLDANTRTQTIIAAVS
ncbi:hypothetical protein BDW22DRAFT_1361234 [Trametopsis cervina]|nr:hypothetical protein BDW22DRAFT_1361234 [Trametopsis cervina]